MTNPAKHTPTPWILSEAPDREFSGNIIWSSKGAGWGAVAETSKMFKSYRANAAFIVKAVNCHDDLLAAAKLGLECLLADTGGVEYEDTEIMRAAIAKAEGK